VYVSNKTSTTLRGLRWDQEDGGIYISARQAATVDMTCSYSIVDPGEYREVRYVIHFEQGKKNMSDWIHIFSHSPADVTFRKTA
jgi:hypothetical protein